MSSLDDLAKNAIPPKTDSDQQPVTYVPPSSKKIPVDPTAIPRTMSTTDQMKENKKVIADPSSLGEPSAPPPPNIYEHWMNNLDNALHRDRVRMWSTIEEAQQQINDTKMFGDGGEDAYFNGEIDTDTTSPSSNPKVINIPKDASVKLKKVNESGEEVNPTPEDDFLTDDSIYENEGEREMADVPKIEEDATFLPGFEEYGDPNYRPGPTPVAYKNTEKGLVTASVDVMAGSAQANEAEEPPKEVSAVFADNTVTSGTVNIMPQGTAKFSDDVIEAAFGEDEDVMSDADDNDEPTEDMVAMQNFVRDNIKPIDNVVDLSSFKVSKRYASAGKALNVVNKQVLHTAKWILPATGQSIIMSAFKGTEIDILANRRQGQTDLMRNEEILKLFYNHVESKKPATWKDWAKTVLYDDLSHLYFAVYLACFAKSNFVPFECEKDKHQFMQPADIMSMVKYKNAEVEAYCKKLYNKYPDSTAITAVLEQVSDDVAIAFRKPTLWNVLIEDMYLPDKVRSELSDIVAIFRHVEDMYIINRDTHEIETVDTKPDATNITKTLKNRFKVYYDILKSLSSDQLNAITPIMSKLHDQVDGVRYQYPEVTCPKCGHIIKTELMQPIDILFTRHRLQIILA